MSYQDYQNPPESAFASPITVIGGGGGLPYLPTGASFSKVMLDHALACLAEAIDAEDLAAASEITGYITTGVANLFSGVNAFFAP